MRTGFEPSAKPTATTMHARRRTLRATVAVLAVFLLIALIGAAVWMTRYQPLGRGGGTFSPEDVVQATGRDVGSGSRGGTVWTVIPTAGRAFGYGFSIRNDGPIGIEVISIGNSATDQQGFEVVRVVDQVDVDPYGPDTRLLDPFEPFTLGPGQDVNVWMRATLRRCPPASTTMGWGPETIRFKVYGAFREVEFRPSITIRVRGGPDECFGR
jgi:hypothetical protein